MPILEKILSIIFIVSLPFLILLLTSYISGWRSIQKKYPFNSRIKQGAKVFKFQSARFNISQYRGVIEVSVGVNGVCFRIMGGFFHKPFSLEWKDIESVSFKEGFFGDEAHIYFDGRLIKVFGKSNKVLRDYYIRHGNKSVLDIPKSNTTLS